MESLALVGAVLGAALFALGAPVIADRLLGLSGTSLTGIAGGMGAQPASQIISYAFSLTNAVFVALAAIVLGILGSLYPVYTAVGMNPAEALRHE